eukprot:gene9471-11621_t
MISFSSTKRFEFDLRRQAGGNCLRQVGENPSEGPRLSPVLSQPVP